MPASSRRYQTSSRPVRLYPGQDVSSPALPGYAAHAGSLRYGPSGPARTGTPVEPTPDVYPVPFEDDFRYHAHTASQPYDHRSLLPDTSPSGMGADPNHPDLNLNYRHSARHDRHLGYARPRSRSPTPAYDDLPALDADSDYARARQGLLGSFDVNTPRMTSPLPEADDWNEKLSALGIGALDGDLSLPRLGPSGSVLLGAQHIRGDLQLAKTDLPSLDEAPETRHFGPAPTGRVGRRPHNAVGHRRIKQSATLDDHGFFTVEMPIPTRLAQFLPVKGVQEQKTTRYTAVTVDPDEFPTSGLRLRQNNTAPPRQTELFVVITMYNEDAELFCRTLYGVMKNISHLCGRKNSRVWGKDGWQKVVVCIVADGRKNVDPRVLDCLAALGVYQEGAMTNLVKDRPVTAHVFEYTTSFALDGDLHFKYPDKGIVPCQIIFCMKEKNAKKINSHRWFFNAFAPLLQPNVCVLLDVGTRPAPKSLYHLWKAFDLNSNVGGACGEIATFKGKTWRSLLNPLVAAQCFEYKMSNILDKPMESLFGYCTVLPGGFSHRERKLMKRRIFSVQMDCPAEWARREGAARIILRGGTNDYRQSRYLHRKHYLAEDRILCFEIVAKAGANWVLKFVKSALAETDCPETLPEFIAQRRRWLNGSFFAALYSLIHVAQLWRSDHSLLRKLALMLEFAYNALNLMFTWFSLANFYIFFVILTSALEGSAFNLPHIDVLNTIARYGYLGALLACFIFGMGNRPQGSPWKYKATVYFFAVLTTYMLVCAVLCAMQAIQNFGSPVFAQMVVSIISTYGVYIVSSILALDPWHLVTCFAQYILFSPTYINVLSVYAYSNLHDLSWGTKGSDTVQAMDLGTVSGAGKHVQVELVSAQQDIDVAYQDALDKIRLRTVKQEEDAPAFAPKQPTEQQQKDIYANFRTNLLLAWSLSNALLGSVVLSGGDAASSFSDNGAARTAVYMLVILVFVAGMAIFRFICSTMYLIVRLFAG